MTCEKDRFTRLTFRTRRIRSHLKWLEIFQIAGLSIIREKVQEGLPEGLFVVKM